MTIHPALSLLALLGVAGFVAARRWRDSGAGWAVLALAATALLAPALILPTGIPSPAATLAGLPPWQSSGDPLGGNPLLRDVTYQIQPWLLFLRGEMREGRLPFWNPHQFSGAPFWANGQSAPVFPLHLLFVALPLQVGFVLLPWLRVLIGGCGVWGLARELGLSRPAALLAALTFPLSGMLVSFLLFPMGNALALVPWVLWTVERIAAERSGWAPLALAGGLQLLGGHPETVAHTALLTALYLAVRGAVRPLAAWLRFVAGWMGAAALAAVQIVPLALTLPETSRWQSLAPGGHPPFPLLLEQPLRLVLPQVYGHPVEGTWWGPFNYSATAVYAGALALPLAAAGLVRCRIERRWLGIAALLVFSFVAAYHWPGLRDVLAALPVFGRAAHHRLLFGVELGLALLLGAGCDRWLEGRGRGVVPGGAFVGVLLAAAWLLHREEWRVHSLLAQQAVWTSGVAAAALLLALSLRLSAERRRWIWPLLPGIVLCDLLLAHGSINPGLPLEQLYPETGAVSFLRGQEGRVAGTGEALRPNAAMVYGLADPRGDDPVKLERFEAVYRSFAPGDPVYFQPIERWDEPWLDRLGVRWVVTGPREAAPVPGWGLAYGGTDARVYERSRALPLVRGRVESQVLHREPGFWEIAWRAPRRGLLIVAETWDRGWEARVEDRPVPLRPVGGALLGIRLGPGEGKLTLRYRPPGFAVGVILSFSALAALIFTAWFSRRPGKPLRTIPQ